MLGNGHIESLALLRIGDGALEGRLCDSKRLRRDADPPAVQCRHRHLETIAKVAKQVPFWHTAALHDEIASG